MISTAKKRTIFVHVKYMEEADFLVFMVYGKQHHWAEDLPEFVLAFGEGLTPDYDDLWASMPIGSVLAITISEDDIADCALNSNRLEEKHIIRAELRDIGAVDPHSICLAGQIPELDSVFRR